MTAQIDQFYTLEVVKKQVIENKLILNFSYSKTVYPDFESYLKNCFFQKKKLVYTDSEGKSTLKIHSTSFSATNYIDEAITNEMIVLDENIYGEVAKSIAVDSRRDFLLSHAEGVLTAEIL